MKKILIFIMIFLNFTTGVSAEGVLWLDNLKENVTGNYNTITDFKHGYAVFKTAEMGSDWGVSNASWGLIDKKGKVVYGPVEGNGFVDVLDKDRIYIRYNGTSEILNFKNGTSVSLDGVLGHYSYEGFNDKGVSVISNANGCGLVNMNGQIIVPCKYESLLAITDEYFVFQSGLNHAVFYYADGSFSHESYTEYNFSSFKNNFFSTYETKEKYVYCGVSDIYGKTIIPPENYDVQFISDSLFLVEVDTSSSYLSDDKGNIIKEIGGDCEATEMYNGKFVLGDFEGYTLLGENGKTLKTFSEDAKRNFYGTTQYCGDGMFSVAYNKGYEKYCRLINGDTGEFVGEKYEDEDIIFNEGYATVRDLEGNRFIIDKEGNRYCEEYSPVNPVSDGVVIVYNEMDENNIPGIVFLKSQTETGLPKNFSLIAWSVAIIAFACILIITIVKNRKNKRNKERIIEEASDVKTE